MKKILIAVPLVLLFNLGIRPETREERHYMNLSFVVWQSEGGVNEAARRIHTPIPEVLKESWICDFITFDITDGKETTLAKEKNGFRFVLTAEYRDRLTLQVYEKENELFRFVHKRPSTVDYVFCGTDDLTYLIELTYTIGNHPIGLLSPGILKNRQLNLSFFF